MGSPSNRSTWPPPNPQHTIEHTLMHTGASVAYSAIVSGSTTKLIAQPQVSLRQSQLNYASHEYC